MPSLVKLLFQVSTRASPDAGITRTRGWSESMWHSADDHATVINAVETLVGPGGATPLLQRRLAILVEPAILVGYRIQSYTLVDQVLVPLGGVTPRRVGRQGGFDRLNDIPGMALQLRMAFGGGHSGYASHAIAGIPDAFVVGGELLGTDAWRQAVSRYQQGMAAGFGAIVQDKRNNAPQKVRTISNTGLAIPFSTFVGIAEGSLVKLRRSKSTASNRVLSGVFRATANIIGGLNLVPWGDRGAGRGGTLVRYERTFAPFDAAKSRLGRVVLRKAGDPFV